MLFLLKLQADTHSVYGGDHFSGAFYIDNFHVHILGDTFIKMFSQQCSWIFAEVILPRKQSYFNFTRNDPTTKKQINVAGTTMQNLHTLP